LNNTAIDMRGFFQGADGSVGGDNSTPSARWANTAPIPNGSTFWLAWWLKYDAAWQWGPGASNAQYWVLSPVGPSDAGIACTGGGSNRILFTVNGNGGPGTPATTQGNVQIGMFPNFCASGSDVNGTTNCCTAQGPNVVPTFRVTPGTEYRFVLEVKAGRGLTGGYRLYANGQLISCWGVSNCPAGIAQQGLQPSGPAARIPS